MSNTPGLRPKSPHFSSGPCAKRPGWSLDVLRDAALGRSHRAKVGKAKLKQAIELNQIIGSRVLVLASVVIALVAPWSVRCALHHPTPPVFDGPDDHNGTRNHDEIRFWSDYIDNSGAL